MLPPRFELHRPRSMTEALEALQRHGEDATPYAGGTEILIAMKARVVRFGHVVDIKRLSELKGVRAVGDGGVSIGALCTHHQLANDPVVRERIPGYAELSGNIANVRVRVAGTVGGNLCFAEPHADPPAMMAALGAVLRLRGPAGERAVDADDFILGELSTDRADGELLERIDVPAMPKGSRAT
jgi:carbon-monoxide dehydrogenase medium subunit